jgi:hypothetical protein
MNKTALMKRLLEAESKTAITKRKILLGCWTDSEMETIRTETGTDCAFICIRGYGAPERPDRPLEELLADFREREAEL